MKYLSIGTAAFTVAILSGLATEVTGPITADTTWSAANSPYVISGPFTINSGATLTIEPGTSVHLGAKVDLVVTNGGRLLAEGTAEKPIHFSRPPNVKKRWGGIVVMGGPNSPETRITYANIEGFDFSAIYSAHGTLRLDHLTFGTRDRQYVSLDGSSFVISHCHFQSTTGDFEPLHGSGGVKAGGRAIFYECFFGTSDGYSDIIDFTGSHREHDQPIVQFYNNVFVGSTDDEIDLDGTDAWIEGNIFMHVHKNGAPDTASAVSGGSNRRDTSQVTIIGNLFFDCDQAATAKEGNFFTLINNTIVHMTKSGGLDTDDGVVCARDLDPRPTTYAAGIYLEGNIVVDAQQLVRTYDAKETLVTFTNNILPIAWEGPGGGNATMDPKLKHIPQLSETHFTNWASAQILRQWFSLQPGSPAICTGPNGGDKCGVIPVGASIAGEPTDAGNSVGPIVLRVGVNRKCCGIPTVGWPDGSGYTHYKWRLDGASWSSEMPIDQVISLAGLPEGQHYVEVVGKRDSGIYQNDPILGSSAVVTRSRTWTTKAQPR